MMTIDDLERVLSLPCDPGAPGFNPAIMSAAGQLAELAADHKGLRAALFGSVQMLLVALALESDDPRRRLRIMMDELRNGSDEMLTLTGYARADA